MKKFLLWSFVPGSRPFDFIVVVLLAFIFLPPPSVFDDRPDFMRVPSDQAIRQARDDDGQPVWIVKVKTEQAAVDRLEASLGQTVTVSHAEPVYDATGTLVAYSIWIQR